MTALNIRLTGAVSIAAGIFLFSGGLIHQLLHNPFGHWIMYIGDILLVFALTGIYAVQARESGWVGLAGYVLSVFGWMVLSVTAFIVLAEVSGLENAHDVFMFMYFNLSLYLPGLYAALLGLVLLGLVTAYTGVLPRYAGILLVLGAISDLPAELVMSLTFMYYVSIFLSMTGLVWIGVFMLKKGAVPQPARLPANPLPATD
jgi:hypothetical protein